MPCTTRPARSALGSRLRAVMEPSAAQIDAYRRDGFVVDERFLEPAALARIRERFTRVFEHDWETGLQPDEVNYVPGVTDPALTRQLCNVWKADRVLASTVLSPRVSEFAARLAGVPGVRIAQDNAIWKPPSGHALLCHQDAAYVDHLDPPDMTTCWMALDDTAARTPARSTTSAARTGGRTPRWAAASPVDRQSPDLDRHALESHPPAPHLLAISVPGRGRARRGVLSDSVAGGIPHPVATGLLRGARGHGRRASQPSIRKRATETLGGSSRSGAVCARAAHTSSRVNHRTRSTANTAAPSSSPSRIGPFGSSPPIAPDSIGLRRLGAGRRAAALPPDSRRSRAWPGPRAVR
jgi:Phytanoyl-CoA dioxygenase (PhyH)